MPVPVRNEWELLSPHSWALLFDYNGGVGGGRGDEWNEWEGRDPTASNAISIEGGGGGTKAFRFRLITLSKSTAGVGVAFHFESETKPNPTSHPASLITTHPLPISRAIQVVLPSHNYSCPIDLWPASSCRLIYIQVTTSEVRFPTFTQEIYLVALYPMQ